MKRINFALILLFSSLVILGSIVQASAADKADKKDVESLLMNEKNTKEMQQSADAMDTEAQQIIDSTYYDWTVLEFKESTNDEKKCYITSFPTNKIGNYQGDREPYVLITRFQDRGTEEVSIYSGYEYKLNSTIYIAIDEDNNYELFTKGNLAWAKTPQLDKEIIQKMLKGTTMKVRGDSSLGSYTVDTYSLKGITRAYKKMKELCETNNTDN